MNANYLHHSNPRNKQKACVKIIIMDGEKGIKRAVVIPDHVSYDNIWCDTF